MSHNVAITQTNKSDLDGLVHSQMDIMIAFEKVIPEALRNTHRGLSFYEMAEHPDFADHRDYLLNIDVLWFLFA